MVSSKNQKDQIKQTILTNYKNPIKKPDWNPNQVLKI